MKSKIPVTDTFEEVKGLVYSIIHEFYNRYKLDYEICVCEGYYGFLQAYDTYNPKKFAFSTWVQIKVTSRLKDLIRNKIKESRRTVPLSLDQHDNEEKTKFDINDWLETLSTDARKVVLLALEPPIDIKRFLAYLGLETGNNYRQSIRLFLQESGWTQVRIKKTFLEIRSSL